MSMTKDMWIDAVDSIIEAYGDSERMPEDFETAMGRLVSMGFSQDEASTMLKESVL